MNNDRLLVVIIVWQATFTNIIPNGSIVIQTYCLLFDTLLPTLLAGDKFKKSQSMFLPLVYRRAHTIQDAKQTNTICNRWIFCGALVVVLILPALETRES